MSKIITSHFEGTYVRATDGDEEFYIAAHEDVIYVLEIIDLTAEVIYMGQDYEEALSVCKTKVAIAEAKYWAEVEATHRPD